MFEQQSQTTSAVQRAAADLRAPALKMPAGEFMGSEENLMVKLGVSWPTLRQATTLVAQEQLITTRRGVNGGYSAAVPSSVSVARMAATFLRSRNTRLTDIVQAVEPIRAELARLASCQPDKALRQRPERVELYRDYRNRMVEAIIDGDEELAILSIRRCTAIVTDWIHEDLRAREVDQQRQGRGKKKRLADAG